jgi:serine/threonine-protein kinase
MSRDDADRNLLSGVLALQAGLIDNDQFALVCGLWARRRETRLSELLVERGLLTPEESALVDQMVEVALARHAGDARASLAAVVNERARRVLADVTDPEAQQTILLAPPSGQTHRLPAPESSRPRQRYTLTRPYAKGGLGQIWIARDDELGREVALKELRSEFGDGAAVRARFVEEARITGQLEHPAIVPVYELVQGTGERTPFYTMRLIRGRSLADAIEAYHRRRAAGEARAIELRELLTAFVTICNAIAYAHSRGVIHRDLKPQNAVLGDFGEVIVLDWGLAKVVGRDESSVTMADPGMDIGGGHTLQGQVLGTPSYMSPEQADGRLDLLDERSDVYGLGAVLYEILTGGPPFAGDTKDVLQRVQRDEPVPPRRHVPGTSRALEAVCLKALAKKPADRYGSARALAQEVQHWLADEPVSAYRAPVSARARRWLGRHRTLATATAAAVLVATAMLGVSTALLSAANERERSARLRAEASLRLARAAVDKGFTRVSENPQLKAHGLEKLRRELLQQARDFYEQFLGAHADDLALQAERARANLRLAGISKDVGDAAESLRAAQSARAGFARLVAAHSYQPEYRDGLAGALDAVGVAHFRAGQTSEARAALEQAREVGAALVHDYPLRPEYRLQQAATLNDLGRLYRIDAGDITAAEKAYREALALCEPLAAGAAAPPEYRSQLADTLSNLATSQALSGRSDQAKAIYEKLLPVREGLIRDFPDVPEYRDKLADTLFDLAVVCSNLRRPEELKALYDKAWPVCERLAREHPDVPAYQARLVQLRALLACALAQLGDYRRASAEIEELLASRSGPALALYNAACAYALASTAAGRDKALPAAERDQLSARYQTRAVELLRRAEDTGFFNSAAWQASLKSDRDLDPLRKRADFRRLEQDVERRARKPAALAPAAT